MEELSRMAMLSTRETSVPFISIILISQAELTTPSTRAYAIRAESFMETADILLLAQFMLLTTSVLFLSHICTSPENNSISTNKHYKDVKESIT